MKLLICIGTRPEAIKMAPICFELKRRGIPFNLCLTAQHRELLDQVINFFDLQVDYDFNLMQSNQSLNKLSSKILDRIDDILERESFNMILVHGDTTTSTIVAMAAFYRGVKVMHVEAGLRTYDKFAPYPEEVNRQLTGRLADFHMAPTQKAKSNLITEGVADKNILVTGNTVVDALKYAHSRINENYKNHHIDALNSIVEKKSKIILVTFHRRENFGTGFNAICNALLELAKENVDIIFPVHLNPNVRRAFSSLEGVSNIHLITPVDYPSFVWLMSKSKVIISDSGGIQEEAPTFNVPVVVTREVTERTEGIDSGDSVLVGTNTRKIVDVTKAFLNSDLKAKAAKNPYGEGNASKKIVDFIQGHL